MELEPYREADSRSDDQEITFCGTRRYCVHKDPATGRYPKPDASSSHLRSLVPKDVVIILTSLRTLQVISYI
jgi:hypothetical protein